MKKLNLKNIELSKGWIPAWNRLENGKFMLGVCRNCIVGTFEVVVDDLESGEFYDIVDNEPITANTLRKINEILKEFGFELTM
jgi:hypothetical protein